MMLPEELSWDECSPRCTQQRRAARLHPPRCPPPAGATWKVSAARACVGQPSHAPPWLDPHTCRKGCSTTSKTVECVQTAGKRQPCMYCRACLPGKWQHQTSALLDCCMQPVDLHSQADLLQLALRPDPGVTGPTC